MDSAVRLFTVRGIDIKVHVTFPLILVWAAVQFGALSDEGWTGAAFGVLVTLLLFGIVVLHELGHSFAALEYDVPITQIVLLPIGGVAQMGRMPDKPGQELVVALAGPAVNVVLAVIMIGLAIPLRVDLAPRALAGSLREMGQLSLAPIFRYLFITNLFIAVFNLLPAFPMDGGRVLRAVLATKLPYARATAIAVAIGQAMAWLIGLWGFLGGGFFMILIAVFIYVGAAQEGQLSRLRSVLTGLRVRQAFSRQAQALSPDDTLQRAVDLTLSTFQSNFPVCQDRQVVGVLTQQRLVDGLQKGGVATPIRAIMQTEFSPVGPDDGLFEVQQKMADGRLDALPVVSAGEFLGLITQQDIAEVFKLASSQPELLAVMGGRG
ncbi:MAG TPA: site-2 protease family protein [Anaerolineales bacterium]|jgi:Zn-dependent protease